MFAAVFLVDKVTVDALGNTLAAQAAFQKI